MTILFPVGVASTFCDLEDTKANMGLAGITIHDAALQGMLEDVTRDFQDYMDYWMFLYDWTEIFDIETTQERCIQLREWPVWTVAGLTDAGLSVTSDLYKLYSPIGEICLEESFFTKGLQTVEVSYRAGYTPANIPKSIRGACQREVSSRFRSREDEDLSYEKIGDYAYRKDTHQEKASGRRTYGFSSATRRVLDHFRDQAV